MGFKINRLSFQKLPEISQIAELAVKTNAPLNNLTVCTKIAESILHSVMRRTRMQRNFAMAEIKYQPTINLANQSDKEN